MSLHPQSLETIPAETARIARQAFPKGSTIMAIRDTVGVLWADTDFAACFPAVGQAAASPARLLLVTLFQYLEGLTDRQAADAVRRCLDWKYALALDLTDPGFDFSVLSEFRDRLATHDAAQAAFDHLLTHCRTQGWLKAHGRQRTDATHVLAAIRTLGRLESVGEMLRHTLDVLSDVAPDWLTTWIPSDWFARYGARITAFRLPKSAAARSALAETIGNDGYHLLDQVFAPSAPPAVRTLPVVARLQRMWWQQFTPTDQGARWRSDDQIPPAAQRIQSPFDPDARASTKRQTTWVGYKVHLTETCDDDAPHLLTHVATVPATTPDHQTLATIHADLAARDLLPREHLVDAGYVTSDTLVDGQATVVDLVGPVQRDHSWQAEAATGYDVRAFTIDWEAQQVVCPQGQTRATWTPRTNPDGRDVIQVTFATATCAACPVRAACTRATQRGRSLTLRPKAHQEALMQARERQTTTSFRKRYARRAGVEGTIAQGTRRAGVRQARYRGYTKTLVQHLLTALAINLVRLVAWMAEVPRSQAPRSRFTRLAPALA
jgi:transposase